jgi:hypothetical protein
MALASIAMVFGALSRRGVRIGGRARAASEAFFQARVAQYDAMKLYVEPMDAVVVAARDDGWVELEREGWTQPTLQERRAIIYAAQNEMAALAELLEWLDASGG